MQVKGLTSATIETIVGARPFPSLTDFIERVPASQREIESLIRCGAFASFGRTRPELMWELRVMKAADDETENDLSSVLGLVPDIPDFDLRRSLEAERETLDMCVAAHPLTMFEEALDELAGKVDLTSSVDLHDHDGSEVDLVGWRVTAKATRTSDKGEEMIFVTFSDRSGRFEAIFFPRVYRRVARELFRARGPYHIRGRVDSELGVVSVIAEDIELLRGGEVEAAY
jgi:DNA polymerase III alpha subunit